MKPSHRILALASVIVLAPAVRADGEEDLATRVHRLFSVKCVECHGSDLRKPKGKFGYVLDLERVANRYVTHKRPDNSELYMLLAAPSPKDRMPPETAKNGPLTAEEIDVVRRWIAEGSPPPRNAEPSPARAAGAPLRLPALAARLHPFAVHFPVALVLAAAFAEVLRVLFRREGLVSARLFLLRLAIPAVLVAGATGWQAGLYAGFSGAPLERHRFTAIAVAGLTLLTAFLGERCHRAGRRPPVWLFPGLLLLLALAVAAAGFLGAELTHGPNHLGL